MMGTYAREGDPLLTVALRNEKELIAVVDQDAIEEVKPAVGKPVWIRGAGFEESLGQLDRIDPRASEQLPDPSLAATEGGPLAVRPRGEDDQDENADAYRLLAPHFLARIQMGSEVADQVPAGMRLTAMLGYRTDPLATRLQTFVRRLWYRAQDEASQ